MIDLRVNFILEKLSSSKFRNSFHLNPKDLAYIKQKSINTIQIHARELIEKRLAPANISNDGKQTPMKGHPVFIAQHATATCCRSCLFKWHHIPKHIELTSSQQDYIVSVIMCWIKNEIKRNDIN